MKCTKCHRSLKRMVSQQRGMGLVCYCRYLMEQSKSGDANEVILEGELSEVGLIVKRLPNGSIAANVSHLIKHHSPTGFECDYSGSGSADLALNVLHRLIPPSHDTTEVSGILVSIEAYALYQDFKRDFIEGMNKDGGCIPISVLKAWVESKLRAFDETAVSFD